MCTIAIPYDVLELILDEVDALPKPDPDRDCGGDLEAHWHTSLKACSRVNRTFLSIAQRRLFRTITIGAFLYLTKTGCFHDTSLQLPSPRAQFLSFLRSSPRITRYVRQLNLLDIVPTSHPLRTFERKKCCFDDDAILSEIFSLLPNLSSLQLKPLHPYALLNFNSFVSNGLYHWDSFPVEFRTAIEDVLRKPSFLSLSMDSFTHVPSDILASASHSLTSLTLQGVVIAGDNRSVKSNAAFQLRSLTLGGSQRGGKMPLRTLSTFLPHLDSFDLSHLRELRIPERLARDYELMSIFTRCGRSLEKLLFHLPPRTLEGEEVSSDLHLKGLTALRSLTIPFVDLSSPETDGSLPGLVRVLKTITSPDLQTISVTFRLRKTDPVSGLMDSFERLDEALARLPSLQRLEVRFITEFKRGRAFDELKCMIRHRMVKMVSRGVWQM